MTKRYTRPGAFPVSLTIRISPDMRAALDRLSARAELPIGEIARQAMERGLPGLVNYWAPSKAAARRGPAKGGKRP